MQTQTSIQTLICRLSPAQCKSLLLEAGIFIDCADPTILRDFVRKQYQECSINAADIRDVANQS